MWIFYLAFGAITFVFAGMVSADDSNESAGPIVLKVVSKKDKYVFDGSGKTPKEYKAELEELAIKQKDGGLISPPKALPVDLVLKLENTSKENVTVYVNGTDNIYTLELTGGAGVVTLRNPVAMPNFIRLPKAVEIEAGKSYELPVASLADGRRGIARLIFWTGPGEYSLTAKYTLLDQMGKKLRELRSDAIKINVVEK